VLPADTRCCSTRCRNRKRDTRMSNTGTSRTRTSVLHRLPIFFAPKLASFGQRSDDEGTCAWYRPFWPIAAFMARVTSSGHELFVSPNPTSTGRQRPSPRLLVNARGRAGVQKHGLPKPLCWLENWTSAPVSRCHLCAFGMVTGTTGPHDNNGGPHPVSTRHSAAIGPDDLAVWTGSRHRPCGVTREPGHHSRPLACARLERG